MQRKHSILYLVLGAALLLLSCSEKQAPSSLTTIPLEEFNETLDAKEIFRRSDYYNMSDWIVPDEKGDLKIQLGKESTAWSLWMRNDAPFGFSMQGGAEKTVRIDIPPIGESASVDVPFLSRFLGLCLVTLYLKSTSACSKSDCTREVNFVMISEKICLSSVSFRISGSFFRHACLPTPRITMSCRKGMDIDSTYSIMDLPTRMFPWSPPSKSRTTVNRCRIARSAWARILRSAERCIWKKRD